MEYSNIIFEKLDFMNLYKQIYVFDKKELKRLNILRFLRQLMRFLAFEKIFTNMS